MTGRDLILYILENGLENELIFKNGRFVGLLTPADVAERLNVGIATVEVWMDMGMLDCVVFEGGRYVPANFEVKIEFSKPV